MACSNGQLPEVLDMEFAQVCIAVASLPQHKLAGSAGMPGRTYFNASNHISSTIEALSLEALLSTPIRVCANGHYT